MQELLRNAGWVAYPLGFFSILALAIVLERLITLSRLWSLENTAFAQLKQKFATGELTSLEDPGLASAPVSQVMNTLLALRGASEEAKQTVADVAVSMQRLRLRRYLSTLATIGSVSPFVGLLGTVLGVLHAFNAMNNANAQGSRLANDIGEALSATAIGLAVAIPSYIAYNYFNGRVQGLVLEIHAHVANLIPFLDVKKDTRARQEV